MTKNDNGYEVNFDGLVGPTHNYSGLSFGNIPSTTNKSLTSNPKEAALQGLEKMRYIASFDLVQGIFPPHERPHIPSLKALGFRGSDQQIIEQAYKDAPDLFYSCCSGSSMWAANSASVTPSIDAVDRHLHFTPANMTCELHRSIEAKETAAVLKKIFSNQVFFEHHPPLPCGLQFSDEGAANHTRFCKKYHAPGVHFFVFGHDPFKKTSLKPSKYPSRQSFAASRAIARLHQIFPNRIVYAQQNPDAIDAGVFHNDLISVGHRHLFLYHESAFVNTKAVIDRIKHKVESICDTTPCFIEVPDKLLSLEEAANTYLFNSQIIDAGDHLMAMIAPAECQKSTRVMQFFHDMKDDKANPIKEVHYVNVLESMQNGGGPACLRLRVALNETELNALHKEILLSEKLYIKLSDWISKHYRDRLTLKDLIDPQLLKETHLALDELTQILNLGSIYSFQKP